MQTAIIIPARFASSRYPGKPLAMLKGATGVAKTLTRRVIEAALAVPHVDLVALATDDERIAAEGRAMGVAVAMTAPERRNGTERVAEALAVLGASPEIVVNLQGDAPLTPPDFVTAVIEAMKASTAPPTATPGLRADGATLAKFREDRAAGRVGGTTVTFRRDGAALYFSKEVIPYVDADFAPDAATPVFHHVGLYGYRPSALARYLSAGPSALERLEGLEQLRFLDIGVEMRVVEVAAKGRDFWELNNPVDVERVEAALAQRGIE